MSRCGVCTQKKDLEIESKLIVKFSSNGKT